MDGALPFLQIVLKTKIFLRSKVHYRLLPYPYLRIQRNLRFRPIHQNQPRKTIHKQVFVLRITRKIEKKAH